MARHMTDTDTARPGWGLAPPEGTTVAWGARAIFRDAYIDVVWDRAAMAGGSDAERKALADWINSTGLRALRILAARYLSPDSEVEVRFSRGGFTIVANARRSYGYLYIGAWPAPGAADDPMPVEHPKPARKTRARRQ